MVKLTGDGLGGRCGCDPERGRNVDMRHLTVPFSPGINEKQRLPEDFSS